MTSIDANTAASDGQIVTTQKSNNVKKLPFLDGIRGFAALWVLVSHCLVDAGCPAPSLLRSGSLAVDLFIIMSGFLMTYHYHLREEAEPWDLRSTWVNFYVRRFFRIAPLYYILLFVAFVLSGYLGECAQLVDATFPNTWFAQAFGSAANFFAYKYSGPDPLNILLHLTFLFGLLPSYQTSTPLPDWSIGLEMQFYAVFPWMMLAFKRFSYFWSALLIVGLGSVSRKLLSYLHAFITPAGFAEPFTLPSFLPLKINLFLIGMLLASAYCLRLKKPWQHISLIGLAVFLSVRQGSPVILGMCILITLILFYDKLRDPFKIRWVVQIPENILGGKLATFMADTSYSVYLLHTMIMTPCAALLLNYSFYTSASGLFRFSLLLAIVLPMTSGLSWLLYNWVEKPGIRLGKNLIKSRQLAG